MDHNLLPQVKDPSRVKIYSWWSTVIRSEKNAFYVLVYGKHYFSARNQNFNIKGVISFQNPRQRILSNRVPLPQVKYRLGVVSNFQVCTGFY